MSEVQVDVNAMLQAISNQRDEATNRLALAEARVIDLTAKLGNSEAELKKANKTIKDLQLESDDGNSLDLGEY